MFPQPRSPILTPRPASLILPSKQPYTLHPSCVLALLPQHDNKWFDYSGNGNHGILHGPTPTAKGRRGFAYSFDGDNDWADAGNDASLDITEAITAAAWLYPQGMTGISAHRRVVSKEKVFYFGVYDTNVCFFLGHETIWVNTYTAGFGSLANNICQHVVWVKDGTDGKVYIDRILQNTQPAIATMGTNTKNVSIGALGPAPLIQHWKGLIDEVRIYNQAWSPNPADPNYLPEIDPGPPPYD